MPTSGASLEMLVKLALVYDGLLNSYSRPRTHNFNSEYHVACTERWVFNDFNAMSTNDEYRPDAQPCIITSVLLQSDVNCYVILISSK